MKIVILSASPKMSSDSVSQFMAEIAGKHFSNRGIETVCLDVRESMKNNSCSQAFATMNEADALMFVFPLYFFCIPGLLMHFLQDYVDSRDGKKKKIYAVVNCGLLDPKINAEALRVIGRFAAHTGNSYRFGVAFGCGGMLKGAQNAPFVKKALKAFHRAIDFMAEDLHCETNALSEDIYIAFRFPKIAYVFMGNRSWRQMAKKNGLIRRDLYRAPYAFKIIAAQAHR
jgi:multimeric flavodoxin WrbA